MSASGRKIRLDFGEDLFFFWRPPVFGLKKRLNFRVSILGQTVRFRFKSNESSGQGHLQFSHSFKKASPPFFKSWLRACSTSPVFTRENTFEKKLDKGNAY